MKTFNKFYQNSVDEKLAHLPLRRSQRTLQLAKWQQSSTARYAQKIVATLLVDLFGGQRRQIAAGLQKKSLSFEPTTGACTVTLGREKSANRATRAFPVPDEVKKNILCFMFCSFY